MASCFNYFKKTAGKHSSILENRMKNILPFFSSTYLQNSPNQDVGKCSIKRSCCFPLEHHSPPCPPLRLSPSRSLSPRENCRIISSLPLVFQSPVLIPSSLFSQALLTTCHVPVSSTSQQRPCFLSLFPLEPGRVLGTW